VKLDKKLLLLLIILKFWLHHNVSKTLQKQDQFMSVVTKIGIQIHAKLGDEIWTVQIPVFFLVVEL
jgi:hypothetical protein